MPESEEERNRCFRKLAFSDIESAIKAVKEDPSLLNVRDGVGETVFHYVVIENRIDLAQKLLDAGSNVDATEYWHTSPLMNAAELGYLEMVKWLVRNGADIDLKDDFEDTALSKSTRNDRRDVFDFLISLVRDRDINFYYDCCSAEDVFDNKDLVMRDKLLSLGLKRRDS